MPSTYGKTWWRGGYACGCIIQSVEDVIEPRLRAAGLLGNSEQIGVYQYAYNSSVSASAGTHAAGGALDHLKGNDAETRIWRESGVADWQRGDPHDDHFDDHNHGIWQGCPHLSDDAAGQIDQYEAGCDGLAGWGPDQSPSVPPITWQQAYDNYASGVLGMTTVDKYSRTYDQTVPADDEWHLLRIDDDGALSLCTGPATFVAFAAATVAGLDDAAMMLRFASVNDYADDRDSTVESWYPILEVHGTAGNSYGQITFTNSIPASDLDGAKLRLRLYAHSPNADVTVTGLTVRCLHD